MERLDQFTDSSWGLLSVEQMKTELGEAFVSLFYELF